MVLKLMPVRRVLLIALILFPIAGEAATTYLYEDFQDGNSDGWRGFGDGVIQTSAYAGNVSLSLAGSTAVVRRVAVAAGDRLRIGASFAASGLRHDNACIAEASIDGGDSWIAVKQVVDGQDDGLTLHSGAVSVELPNDESLLWLRARVNSGTCWLDNVFVIGHATAPIVTSNTTRELLPKAFFIGGEELSEPVAMQAFAMPADASDAMHSFSGTLRIDVGNSSPRMRVVADDWDRLQDYGETISLLPEFEFQFVQRGDDLVPLQRGVQRSAHPYWEIVLQPGKIWNEAADEEWTRASIPFSLQERSANCTHNGVMTWLFDGERVSRVAYQVGMETCGYLKLDLWGTAPADYSPQDLSLEAEAHIRRLDAHRASRLPIRELADLTVDYPGVETLGLGIEDGLHPDGITVLGLVVNGVNYRSDCQSRYGAYPYCDSLPLPSYSTAKSIFAAVAAMRMEALYPGSMDRTIASVLPECDTKRWRDVTVGDALDMATGNYRSREASVDEDSAAHVAFIFDEQHHSKLDFACRYFKRKAEPGTQFVYHTSDTYLVGAALNRMLAEHRDGADIYDQILYSSIWRRLELSPLLDDSKRTYDDDRQPFAGYGLTYEVDDMARIARWLASDRALLDDEPYLDVGILDAAMLDAALQRDSSDRGLDAGFENLKYNNGFWAFNAGPSLACRKDAWIPFMSGVSGITVAMFPNDVIYYYFSDSYVYRWQSARRAAHAIEELCQ